MITIIAGPRDYDDYNTLLEAIKLVPWEITEVVCGESTGVDQLGKRWAQENGIKVHSFPADWNRYGRAAGPKRNREMAKFAAALLALQYSDFNTSWNRGRGTRDMINAAEDERLFLYVHYIEIT